MIVLMNGEDKDLLNHSKGHFQRLEMSGLFRFHIVHYISQ